MIMKKKYILPSTCIVDVELHLLNGNSLDPTKLGDQKITPDDNEPSPDEFTSRRGIWDDEDEDY